MISANAKIKSSSKHRISPSGNELASKAFPLSSEGNPAEKMTIISLGLKKIKKYVRLRLLIDLPLKMMLHSGQQNWVNVDRKNQSDESGLSRFRPIKESKKNVEKVLIVLFATCFFASTNSSFNFTIKRKRAFLH